MTYQWREIVEISGKKYLLNVDWVDGEVKKYYDVAIQNELSQYEKKEK